MAYASSSALMSFPTLTSYSNKWMPPLAKISPKSRFRWFVADCGWVMGEPETDADGLLIAA